MISDPFLLFNLYVTHESEKPRRHYVKKSVEHDGSLFIAEEFKKIKLRRSDLFFGMMKRLKAAHEQRANKNERTYLSTHPIKKILRWMIKIIPSVWR
jgi:hypothetical protein